MKDRYRVVHVSDLHCGNVSGVAPPPWADTKEWHKPLWEWLQDISKQIGRADALVANGDLIDGPGKRDSSKHLTTDFGKQVKMSVEVLGLFPAHRTFVVRGTGYHTDSGTAFEDFVADAVHCEARDELRLKIWESLAHFRHVVGRSDTPYAQGTQDMKELTNEQMQGEMEDYEYADFLGRAHVHYSTGAWRWNSRRGKKQEIVTNPALQLRLPLNESAYVRKLRTWMYHVGLTVIDFWKDAPWVVQPVVCPIRTCWLRHTSHKSLLLVG